jgi:exopolysaccharide production protein ExoQ
MTSPSQSIRPSVWEQGFVVATALIFWTDILSIIFPGELDAPSFPFRVTVLAIYAVVLFLLMRRPDDLLMTMRLSPALMLLLFLPLFSVLWSIQPNVSFHRGFALLGSSMFGVYLATHMHLSRSLILLGTGSTFAALISLALIVAVPAVGLMPDGEYVGVWRGAYSHKNAFGQMTALGAILCWLAWQNSRGGITLLFAIGLSTNCLLLAGSKSVSAQLLLVVCTVVLLVAGPLIRSVVNNFFVLLPFLVIAAIGATVAHGWYDVSSLFFLIGKDATLTARVPMWSVILPFADERFWLGYGYEVFWMDGHYPVDIIVQRIKFNPVYSHNGLLELWLNLGALGIAVFSLAFMRFVYLASAMLYRVPKHPIYLLSFVFIVLMVMQNISEVTLLARNSMSWVLFVMLSVVLSLKYRERGIEAVSQQRSPVFARQNIKSKPRLPVV